MPEELTDLKGLEVENRSVEEIFASSKSKVCLLDPSAAEELSPLDGEQFEVFLFGGILGMTDTPGEQMNDLKPPPNLLTVQSLHRR